MPVPTTPVRHGLASLLFVAALFAASVVVGGLYSARVAADAALAPAPAPVVEAPCQDLAVLPDVGVPYLCPAGTEIAVHDLATGPALLCLCPVTHPSTYTPPSE